MPGAAERSGGEASLHRTHGMVGVIKSLSVEVGRCRKEIQAHLGFKWGVKMIKKCLGRIKCALTSNAPLPWIYGVYAVVFLLYAIARVWNYINCTANTDPVWLTEASPSAQYIIQVIPFACLVFFALATLLVRAKSANRDALGRAHCRYMLQTFWLIAVFWAIEIFLYWSPLALATWLFAMPLRLAGTGFYVLAFARSVWGLRQCLRGEYPTSRDLPLHKTRGVKWLLLSFPTLLLLNWLVTSGSWYIQDYFSKPGNTHTLTYVTKSVTSDPRVPRKLRLVYRMGTPGPGCLDYNPITGNWTSPRRASMWLRAPDVTTDHEQIFHFSKNEMTPGYCDWRFDHAQIISGDRLAEYLGDPQFREVRHSGKGFVTLEFGSNSFFHDRSSWPDWPLPNGQMEIVKKYIDGHGGFWVESKASAASPSFLRIEHFVDLDDPKCQLKVGVSRLNICH